MEENTLKILNFLSQDCRISTSMIAKKLKMPRHIVAYHRNQLSKKKIIINNEMLLDYGVLGYIEYLVYLKIFQYSTVKKGICQRISANPNVRWFGEVFPNFNLRFCFIAKNHEELEEFVNELELEYKNYIIKKEVLIHRGFLKKESYAKNMDIECRNDKHKQRLNLTKVDKEIIIALDKNPTISLIELSKRTSISIETIRQKIKKFKEAGLIELFSAKHEAVKVGHNFWCVLLLKMKSIDDHQERLKTLLYSDLKFGRTRKTFGQWDLEMTIYSANYNDLLDIVDNLEHLFGDDLESHQIQVYRENFIPTRLVPKVFS